MADRKHKTLFELTATDGATRVFQQVGGGLDVLKGKYLAVAAAATAAFEAGGAAAFVVDAARYRSTLEDLSDTTGDNVRTLDAMARQARVSGIEIDQLGTNLARFAKNLNSADDEGKDAAKAIEAIGLNVEQLRALKPAEAMFEVAKALGTFEGGAAKVAVAVALMGKEGAKMLPYFKDLAETGELNGRVTAEQAKQAKELEQQWRRLGLAFSDSKDELSTALIPVLADFSEELAKAIRLTGGLFGALKLFARDLGRGFATPYEQMQLLNNEIEKLKQTQAAYEKRGDTGLARSVGETIASKTTYRDYLQFLNDQELRAQYRAMGISGPDIHAQPKRLEFSGSKDAAGAEKDPRLSPEKIAQMQAAAEEEFNQEVQKWRREQIEATKKYNDELQKSADHYRDLIDPLRKFGREWETLDELLRQGVISQEEYLDAYVKVAEAADKARLEIEGVSDEAKRSKNAFHEMGFTATSALEEIIFKGGQASDIIRALGQDLAKIFLRKTVFDPLAAGAGKFFDGLFKAPETASTGDFSAGGGFENVNWEGAFAGGGSFSVGGRGGTDSQLVAFKATPGEHVSVSTPGHGRGSLLIQNGDINIMGEGVTMSQVRQALAVQHRQTLIAVREDRRR